MPLPEKKTLIWPKKGQILEKKSQKAFNNCQKLWWICCFFWCLAALPSPSNLMAQSADDLFLYTQADPLDSLQDQHFLRPATEFDASRFWVSSGIGSALYAGTTYALWQTWYADYPGGSFQTINDWPEWLQMDKAGHTFTAYQYSRYAFAGARWTGMSRPAE